MQAIRFTCLLCGIRRFSEVGCAPLFQTFETD